MARTKFKGSKNCTALGDNDIVPYMVFLASLLIHLFFDLC